MNANKKEVARVKKMLILLLVLAFAGCSGMFCKPVVKSSDQIVFKHGSASNWFEQAYQEAQAHCAQYGKKAKLNNTDCTMGQGKASLYSNPGLNCVSIFDCE